MLNITLVQTRRIARVPYAKKLAPRPAIMSEAMNTGDPDQKSMEFTANYLFSLLPKDVQAIILAKIEAEVGVQV